MSTTTPFSCDEPKTESNQPWWNRRMERIMVGLFVICMLLCVLIVAAFAYIGYIYQNTKLEGTSEKLLELPNTGRVYCITPGCVKAAAAILHNMDETVSPCDDFYEFACGGWIQKHRIPDDRSVVSAFSVLQNEINFKLLKMIESPINENDPQYILNVKNMYNSCMNTTRIETLGSSPLEKVIRDLGGWPAVEGRKWDQTRFDWMEALIALRRMGLSHNTFFSISVGPDDRNNTRRIIYVGESSLGVPDRKYLLIGLEDPIVAAYYQMMVSSAVLLGSNRATAEREMKEALEFETKIANITLPEEKQRNNSQLYNKMTLAELSDLSSEVNWDRYMNSLLMDKIPRSEDVIVSVPEYIRNMERLLLETDKKIIANYLIWRVVEQNLWSLSKAWREILQNYSTIVTGKVQESRWRTCWGALYDVRLALSSLYVRSHFKESSRDSAQELVNYVHREFMNIVTSIDWMDDKTRGRAIEKLKKMKSYIGYPDEILDEYKVAAMYDKLNLHPSNFFENLQIAEKWSKDERFSKLRKPVIKGDWKRKAASYIVNAFYNIIENRIELPAGILQGVFFSMDKPNYLNFGAIGVIIGHEITHGFDDFGRQFDKDGNDVNWWEPETDATYKKKAQCLIDQFNAYNVTEVGIQINGFKNQGENIADHGGIKEAYLGYEQWIKDHGAEDSLPGLKYTPKQLFWISASHVWCSKYRPEILKLIVNTGYHSPDRFRVIGPFSNTPEFAKDFNCPLGSPMNPEKKCSVW